MVRYKYGIIVIAYNRLESIKRLLTQLNKCDYRKEDVSLIISIDNNRSEKVIEYCRNYKWLHGNKTVITYPKRLGLRNHVLKCGDYINKYSLDAVAVFEDDVFPSIGFYQYMVQAVDFYYNDVDVAGISLYSHQINVNANLNFIPSIVNSDVYFMQFAQSWGQIWMKNQWKDFIEWYKKKVQCSDSIINEDIPTFVANWPETSWLKYHIQYCIENNKYFVYPYHALTSCFSDVGEHTNEKNTNFQVPLYEGVKLNYKFITLHDEKSIKYDAFFERMGLERYLNFKPEDLCVDIYGQKPLNNRKYLLTTKIYDYKVIKSFALEMRPQEANIINNIIGNSIFLYNTAIKNNNRHFYFNKTRNFIYYYKLQSHFFNIIKTVGLMTYNKIKKIIRHKR